MAPPAPSPATPQSMTRSLRKRKRINYVDESDVDLDRPRHPSNIRSVRQNRRIAAYNEQDSSSENSGPDSSDDSTASHRGSPLEPPTIRSARRAPSTVSQQIRRSQPPTEQKSSINRSKRRKPNPTDSVARSQESKNYANLAQGHIPPWQDLEPLIWVQIFQYAASLQSESTAHSSSWASWLACTSLLCKSFHVAAISVLLQDPPLFPSSRARALLDLLQRDPETLSTNFSTKIRRLEIDVKRLLLKKSGISLSGLLAILTHAPLVRHLRFFHPHDGIHAVWAQPGLGGKVWQYPTEIFDTLDLQNIELEGFEWNGRFGGTSAVLEKMREMHPRSCMRSLKTMRIYNLNLSEKSTLEERSQVAQNLAKLSDLQSLTALEFRNCNVADGLLAPYLPVTLKRLSFFACNALTSSHLQGFLALGGGILEELTLASNQAMDLAFMPQLAELTPLLQNLKMDFNFPDPTSYKDTAPWFEDLLPNGPPTWPSTLREIEISNLRNLSLEQMDSFLGSLVDAAGNLLQLRRISIKAMPAGSWRDRAHRRAKWQKLLAEVFEHEPQTHADPRVSTSRRQSRRAAPKQFDDGENSDGEPAKSTQIKTFVEEDIAVRRQGMCRVTLTVDNQRPSELQYKDEDFLDDEQSGDEEWKA